MKLIFIRGLPGAGKSSLAASLAENLVLRLYETRLISSDQYKLEACRRGLDFPAARQEAYRKTIEEIRATEADYLITEEIICDLGFYKQLQQVASQVGERSYWFRINRPIEQLMEVEKTRKRKVKNSYEDFQSLKQQMDAIKIPGEIQIDNHNLKESLRQMLVKIIK